MKKVILELYLNVWYCYEDKYNNGMANSLFTTTSYKKAEKECNKRKYEIVQVIDLELQNLED